MAMTLEQQRALAIADAKRRQAESANGSPDTATPPQSRAAGMLDSFTHGVTFGFGDELTALESAVPALFDERSFGETYDKSLAAERAQRKRFAQEYPVLSAGAEVAGGIATALTPVGAVGQVTGRALTAPALLRGAGVGVGSAALYGAGTGEGGAINRLESAADPINLAIGGAGGVAGNVLQAGAGKLGRMLRDRKAIGSNARALGVDRPAYNIARESARNADANIQGGASSYIRQGGPDAMIGDVLPGELDYVTNVGAGSTIARQNLGARVDRAATQVDGAIDTALGPAQGVRQTARDIATSTRANRNATYRSAYAQPIDYGTGAPGERILATLERIPARTLREAVDEANEAMTAAGVRNQQILIDIAADGTASFRELPNVQQLDEIKKALQTTARENVDQFGRRTARGNRANDLAYDLRSALGGAVPEYNAATLAGADKITQDQALELGQDLLRPTLTKEHVREGVARFGPAERARAAQGARAYIDEVLGNVKMTRTDPSIDQREAWKALQDILTRNNRAKLESVLGPQEAGQLFTELEAASRAFGVRAGSAGNSATASRGAMDARVNESVAGIGAAPDRMPRPNIMDAALAIPGRAYNAATGQTPRALQRSTDATRMQLAELLTGLRGQQAVQAFEKLLSDDAALRALPNHGGRLSQLLGRAPRLATPPAVSPPIQN